MTGRDIVDDIDALIDEQLAAGETGQARRAAQADRRCWHCGRSWHGLAITARMEQMRREYLELADQAVDRGGELEYAESAILGDYRYADDDSEVLCPGSEFIGPMPAKVRGSGCQCDECQIWRTRLAELRRAQPLPAARWWRLDVAANRHQHLEVELSESADERVELYDGRRVPTSYSVDLLVRVGTGFDRFQGVIRLRRDSRDERFIVRHYDRDWNLTLIDIHTTEPDTLGGRIVWHEIDGPGGNYVRSRALIATDRLDQWFDDRGLWFLAPREFRTALDRLLDTVDFVPWQRDFVNRAVNAIRRRGDNRPGRGAPYLPGGVVLQRGDTVGYEIGGRVYTGYVTDVEPGPRGDDTVLRLDGSRTEEFTITLNDPPPSIRRLFGLAAGDAGDGIADGVE